MTTAIDTFKRTLAFPSVQEQFKNALADNAPLFISSLIDIYSNDKYLQKCNPNAVIMEALKSATLKLPINKNLGFAWIVPYGNEPQFQIGWKGYVQLAIRTGQYRYLNAGTICEGQKVNQNWLTGSTTISGTPVSNKVLSYFAYFQLCNGFEKTLIWSVEEVHAHAKKYSKSYSNSKSAWKTNADEMAIKTVLTNLLRKYGFLSVEIATALSSDHDERIDNEQFDREVIAEANQGEIIDLSTGEITEPEPTQQETSETTPSVSPDF